MNRNLAASRRSLREAIGRRRLLDILIAAVDQNLDQDFECAACEVHAVKIEIVLRRTPGGLFRPQTRVIPEYGPVRPLTAPDRAP